MRIWLRRCGKVAPRRLRRRASFNSRSRRRSKQSTSYEKTDSAYGFDLALLCDFQENMHMQETLSETRRLEELWQGEFGDTYVDRNSAAGEVRESFWQALLAEFPARNVLEVGCNLGA